ncbi:hypothetical protein D3C72_1930470 [compost metagenome]
MEAKRSAQAMICGSNASTEPMAAGRWRSALRCSASCSSVRLPRVCASARVKRNSAVSWVVKALVEATPISTPARVMYDSLHSRTMALVDTLQMVSVFSMPSERACFRAASVSAVSPDCEMVTTSERGLGTLSR